MISEISKTRSPELNCAFLLIVFLPTNGLEAHKVDTESTSAQSRSFQTGLDSVIGAVHSKLRSVFRKQENLEERIRRKKS